MQPSAWRRFLEYFGGIALLAILYFATAKFGLSIAYVHPSATTVWAPTGISFVALLIFGFRFWPGIFAGAFLANITTEGNLFTSFGIALGNTLEALVLAYLVQAFASGVHAFSRAHTVFLFTVSALIASTISASIGVGSLLLGGFAETSDAQPIWLAWWLGDVGGALLVAPFILTWWGNFRVEWSALQFLEILAVIAAIFATAFVVFGPVNFSFDFLAAPALVWLILRFSTRETASGILLFSALAIGGTLNGYGRFAEFPPEVAVLYLQAFLIVAAMSALVLSAMVTERRSAAAALLKADQAKDDFLASLSHELRNPLASTLSYLQLLQLDDRPQEEKHMLQNMRLELRHATALLEDLLDLSRIRRRRMILRKQTVDVTPILEEAGESFRPIMHERQHVFEMKCEPRAFYVNGDRSRIKQIVVNLLSNAAKYTEPGGRITLTSKGERSMVVISVKDTGVGISKKHIRNLLGQESSTVAVVLHPRSGLGVGLPLVKHLVDMHGGTFEVESAGEKQGSIFTVSLPLVPAPLPLETSEKVIELPAAKEKRTDKTLSILVVDDNKKAADALAKLLSRHGYHATAVYDGASAIHHIAANDVGVAILDIALPDIGGREIAEKIRQKTPPKNRPHLIALSGYGADEDVRRSLEAGFSHHLLKPVDIAELQSILEKI
ncbi:MASE1 domain-containing protein [Candidatus Kaiserbacteria bacterium]|nr:MASE1 domain-containing protein [Candidatus Kaiserbacteria bacterium]